MIRRKLIESARLVLSTDPAVDHNKCNYDHYIEADYDESHLKYVAGEVPTVFVIAPLTRKQRVLAAQAPSDYVKKEWIVLLGIRDVLNYALVDAQGREKLLAPPEQKDGMPEESWLEQAKLSLDELEEIAAAIERIGSLRAPLLNASGAVPMP